MFIGLWATEVDVEAEGVLLPLLLQAARASPAAETAAIRALRFARNTDQSAIEAMIAQLSPK